MTLFMKSPLFSITRLLRIDPLHQGEQSWMETKSKRRSKAKMEIFQWKIWMQMEQSTLQVGLIKIFLLLSLKAFMELDWTFFFTSIMFYTAFDSCAWFFSIFSFVTYKTILLRYLVFGKVIFKGSFKHARIGGFFQEDYKLHTFPNVRTPQKITICLFHCRKEKYDSTQL